MLLRGESAMVLLRDCDVLSRDYNIKSDDEIAVERKGDEELTEDLTK